MTRPGKGDGRLSPGWAAAIADHAVAVGWSADGRFLAAAAASGPVAVFDATTGKLAAELPGHRFGTLALAWQPNGHLLATAGQDGVARLWDPAAGTPPVDLAGGAAWVERLAWSPDGRALATAAGRKVRLWAPAGSQLREFAPLPATAADLAWRPDGRYLTVAAYGGVALYDPAAADPVRRFDWKGAPLTLAWSPTGRHLAHGNQDATVHFWDAAADAAAGLQMSGYQTKVRELSWDYTGRYLATGGGEAVCVWDCGGAGPEGTKPQMFDGHADLLTAVAWQRRGFLLASAGRDGRVCLWQPANKKGPQVGRAVLPVDAPTALAWAPDDKRLAAGAADGTVAVYRVG